MFRGETVSCVRGRDCVLCSEERLCPVFKGETASCVQRRDCVLCSQERLWPVFIGKIVSMLPSLSHATLKVSCYQQSPMLFSKSHATLKVPCYSQSPIVPCYSQSPILLRVNLNIELDGGHAKVSRVSPDPPKAAPGSWLGLGLAGAWLGFRWKSIVSLTRNHRLAHASGARQFIPWTVARNLPSTRAPGFRMAVVKQTPSK